MTFRAKPVRGKTRATWDAPDRRNLLMNIGFGLVVVVALGILALAAGLAWYDEHLAPAATVGGESISKDEWRERVDVESVRLDLAERRLRDRLNAGTIRETDFQSQQQLLEQQRQVVGTIALERLIDARIQATLAAEEGVSVDEAAVDAKLAEEATTPELRHGWLIEVEPEVSPDADEPTAAQIAAAKTEAEQALADIRGGKDWQEVAKDVSTHATRDQGGDIGFITADASLDEAFIDALFAAQQDEPTDVLVDADGVARIGLVTQVVPEQVTPDFETLIANEGVSVASYREALRAEVVREKLEEKIVADVTKEGPQRLVRQIYMQYSAAESEEGAIRVRHILYSPNDDPDGAADADEAAWSKAEQEARAAYDKLKADISQFDALAREESDEGYAATSGGKLPYYSPDSGLDEAFADAIFQDGLEAGELLEPVKTSFGWHVIQVMHRPTDFDWARQLKERAEAGESFAALARDNGDGSEAADGGSIGWVAKGQLRELLELRVFETPVGEISEPLAIPNDGVYLFQIEKEEVRTPEGEQLTTLRETAFDNWYSQKKALVSVERHVETSLSAE